MTSIPDFLSLAMTLVVLGLVIASVMKLFQIAADLGELKEILKDMRRISQGLGSSVAAPEPLATPGVAALRAALPSGIPPAYANPEPAPAPTAPAAFVPAPGVPAPVGPVALHPFGGNPPTPEELVRAIHAHDFSKDEFPL